jgi:hypothetical protein
MESWKFEVIDFPVLRCAEYGLLVGVALSRQSGLNE